MSRSYWASPGLFAAYLHFFLPWNLYRLSWLLPGLDLPLRKDARILDLGSGPLTLPIALWCARPELRALPLQFTCVDISLQAMERGLALFNGLAGENAPWQIRLFKGPLEKSLPSQTRGAAAKQPYDCVMGANVLNELGNERSRASAVPLEQRLAALMSRIIAALRPGGRILLVEPGTRLGGKVISFARSSALESGCSPLAPCTHSGPCPMQPRGEVDGEQPGQSYSGWCHFTHPAHLAPEALLRLGEEARLQKRGMALSCLLLQTPERPMPEDADEGNSSYDLSGVDELESLFAEIMEEDGAEDNYAAGVRQKRATAALDPTLKGSAPAPARVISSPITLPGREEPGRYACCEHGLALLLNARSFPSGALVEATPLMQPSMGGRPARVERDRKSGALLLQPAQAAGKGEHEKGASTKRPSEPKRESPKTDAPPKKPLVKDNDRGRRASKREKKRGD